MTIRAVIFDLDGTLVNSLEDIADAVNEVLAARGLPTHPTAGFREFAGNGVRHLIQSALPPGSDKGTLEGVMREYSAAYARRYLDKTRPYDGMPDTLRTLRAQGYALGIFSNKPDDMVQKLAAAIFPGVFAFALGKRDDFPHKPSPEGALIVAHALGADPAECAFVGDSDVDMLTAAAAGMFPIGAEWGFRGAEELRRAGARLVAPVPAALPDLIPRVRTTFQHA